MRHWIRYTVRAELCNITSWHLLSWDWRLKKKALQVKSEMFYFDKVLSILLQRMHLCVLDQSSPSKPSLSSRYILGTLTSLQWCEISTSRRMDGGLYCFSVATSLHLFGQLGLAHLTHKDLIKLLQPTPTSNNFIIGPSHVTKSALTSQVGHGHWNILIPCRCLPTCFLWGGSYQNPQPPRLTLSILPPSKPSFVPLDHLYSCPQKRLLKSSVGSVYALPITNKSVLLKIYASPIF